MNKQITKTNEMEKKDKKKLADLIKSDAKASATKNVNEHLNCTKQGCFSSWS